VNEHRLSHGPVGASAKLLLSLLVAGILGLGLLTGLAAEASPAPERVYETSRVLRLGSPGSRIEETALELFREGCVAAQVMILPDRQGRFKVVAICVEWREHRPTSP
jgi:hypothetical protein